MNDSEVAFSSQTSFQKEILGARQPGGSRGGEREEEEEVKSITLAEGQLRRSADLMTYKCPFNN